MAFLALLVAVPAYAQKITGTMRGTVTDPTGAIIAGAKVTIKNEDTGLTRSVTTTSAGIYSFAELPVGSYRVEVEHPGLQVRGPQQGHAERGRRARGRHPARDRRRQRGGERRGRRRSRSRRSAPTSRASSPGRRSRALPLNGRNFMQLTLLQPGVTGIDGFNTIDKGLAGGSDVSVSGGSVTTNLWTVDGANNNDVGSNRTILVYPSVDAIEEFKIQRNNYGAEFGQSGGAQINLVTRGGTNEFHGSGYWFARRDGLNSTDFFLKQASREKAPLKWDDFGGTLGGPILKDKLHFFVSLEWNKDKRSDVRTSFVPTAAERSGDFSGSLAGCSPPAPIDPLTGQPFPGEHHPGRPDQPRGPAHDGPHGAAQHHARRRAAATTGWRPCPRPWTGARRTSGWTGRSPTARA